MCIRDSMYLDIQNLDPARRISQNDYDVSDCILRGLVRYAPNSYDIYNDLAESIKQVSDTVIEFKLREGVKWDRDFGEVTTEDVKFSYERFLDPNLKSSYKDDWATLDKVEIVDKYRGKIILKQPFAPLWKTTLPVASGDIMCKKFVEQAGLDKIKTDLVGCGPYSFVEWKPKERVVIKRNPNYFGKPAPFDEIHFLPIDDDKAAEVALEAGEIDWGRIAIGSIERFEAGGKLKVWVKPALRYRWVGMNVTHPKLQDINVRQAIRYGVDVESIVKAAYRGRAEVEYAMIAPGLLGHWKDAPKYKRDVEKAKDFLKKAGLTTLDLKFTCQNTTEYKTWGEIMQQNLKDVGINLTVEPLDSSVYSGIGFKPEAANLELHSGNFSMQPDPSWATAWFTCAQIPGWNYLRWCNKEYDELHAKGLVTIDEKEREKIYIRMQQIWDEACHSIWISHGIMCYAYSPKIKPASTPHGIAQVEFFDAA